jgi:hypothetical protein
LRPTQKMRRTGKVSPEPVIGRAGGVQRGIAYAMIASQG